MRILSIVTFTLALAIEAVAGEGSLSLAPAVVMLRGVPGQSTTQTMKLTNTASQPFSFDLKAQDVVVRDGRRVSVDAGELPGSIAASAAFSRKSVTLAPGESVRVNITVTIPAKPCGRAVLALFRGTTKIEQGSVGATVSLGMLLTFALSDDVLSSTTPLEVHPPTATSNLTIAQQLGNSGNEPFVATGMLAIVSSSGALVGRTPVPSRRLLPGERTDVHSEYAGDLAPGHYRALMTYQLAKTSVTSSAEFDVR
ncbi:MAG TPA: hypothetical protein VLC46_10605 [Thermoanaerobaculia bacterium]|jgi:hypothetical protein|nr:hypothetical protein [Thermoanaerobaculia bacterium]